MFLKTDTIGITPIGGYHMEDRSLLRLINGWCTLVG